LQTKVEDALVLVPDSYFYSAHVTVSVKNGTVFLQGFDFSDWDLRDAIRIATKASGRSRVVDNLAIEAGGRKWLALLDIKGRVVVSATLSITLCATGHHQWARCGAFLQPLSALKIAVRLSCSRPCNIAASQLETAH
jgi:hypothetical protein